MLLDFITRLFYIIGTMAYSIAAAWYFSGWEV
jgi:hypothetical protein